MASSEWMELENISRDIADSHGRLEAARSVGSNGLAQVLQKEITALEDRRSQLLAKIANSVVADQPEPTESQAAAPEEEPVEEEVEDEVAEPEPPSPEIVTPLP